MNQYVWWEMCRREFCLENVHKYISGQMFQNVCPDTMNLHIMLVIVDWYLMRITLYNTSKTTRRDTQKEIEFEVKCWPNSNFRFYERRDRTRPVCVSTYLIRLYVPKIFRSITFENLCILYICEGKEKFTTAILSDGNVLYASGCVLCWTNLSQPTGLMRSIIGFGVLL